MLKTENNFWHVHLEGSSLKWLNLAIHGSLYQSIANGIMASVASEYAGEVIRPFNLRRADIDGQL